jgi:hypothetical protein
MLKRYLSMYSSLCAIVISIPIDVGFMAIKLKVKSIFSKFHFLPALLINVMQHNSR